jgi:hypothetical protein
VTGTLSISDDAAGNPQTVSLTGTGSTNTPPLTGYCATPCQRIQDSAQCPPGQPAKHPMGLYCPAGVLGGRSVPVDGSTRCMTGGSTRVAQGFCETH